MANLIKMDSLFNSRYLLVNLYNNPFTCLLRGAPPLLLILLKFSKKHFLIVSKSSFRNILANIVLHCCDLLLLFAAFLFATQWCSVTIYV